MTFSVFQVNGRQAGEEALDETSASLERLGQVWRGAGDEQLRRSTRRYQRPLRVCRDWGTSGGERWSTPMGENSLNPSLVLDCVSIVLCVMFSLMFVVNKHFNVT